MSLKLEITSGPMKGFRHRLSKGFTIGRNKGDLILNDPKISGLHAEVEEDPSGRFCLIDLGSSNGILVNENRVSRLPLQNGVTFKLGRTMFLVTETISTNQKEDVENKHWTEILRKNFNDPKNRFHPKKTQLLPFKKPMKLVFIKGVQYGTEWIIAYGPRKIGSRALQFQVLDPDAPFICFEVMLENQGVLYVTKTPDIVRINHEALERKTLAEGDVISFGSNELKVHFMDKV